VDFELSEEEVALGESVRALCAARFPLEALQQAASLTAARPAGRVEGGGSSSTFDRKGWAALASSGVFALQVPEADEGVGLGMAPATVVFEELGRALVPGPLVSTHLAAREASAAFSGADEGKVVVGSIGRPPASGPEALPPLIVGHLANLDVLAVVSDGGIEVVEPSSLQASQIERSLDPLTPMWRVDQLPAGESIGDSNAAARWRRDESVLVAALLVGLAARCVEMAVQYAKEREQFGRPIGSFQAVKHICADMLVRAETARVAVQAAALTVDQPDVGDAERAAAGAALLSAEAAQANAKACIQVHGGMGFTWEVPVHLYLMRARVLAESLGPRGALAELVADRY
jgi:alkylation response protein AidB-like acyl-CoA dehydrogenase